jgi:hypothetical protein
MIGLIIAAVALLVAIIMTILNWDHIVEWLRSRQNLKEADKDNIAFDLQQRLKNGQFETVTGIFNKRTNELLDGEKIRSDKIDEKIAEIHKKEPLAIFN